MSSAALWKRQNVQKSEETKTRHLTVHVTQDCTLLLSKIYTEFFMKFFFFFNKLWYALKIHTTMSFSDVL